MIKQNQWYSIHRQSLAVAARNAGFDLAIFNDYSVTVQAELRKRSIRAIMDQIASAFEDSTNFPLSRLKTGVYVISLSAPLTIQYPKKRSAVIYIGLGNVPVRIKHHFDNSLFDFMQSLSGADFDFRFANPNLAGKPEYYKQIEYEMLEYFRNSMGRLPLLNSNSGSNKGVKTGSDWWSKPLKGSGTKPRWALQALPGSAFEALD